ncbi:MAG TPA: response regulator [Burkholderiaceae bacterium]|nr:response regulator [Burkholderiaceae bacterium]
MAPRILVVEDEPDIASVLVDYLRREHYEVQHLADGEQALAQALAAPPALVLLDVMLPGRDGMSVLKALRQTLAALPVIMLTARVEEIDRLLGLELGADDYICKPFSPREVVARVKAVLRRGLPTAPPQAPVEAQDKAPDLLLDKAQWQASLRGRALHLTPKEFMLLQTLARQPGRIFSRRQLLELAYADELDASERAIDSHVKNLRRKFAAVDAGHDWIRSVYGVGFALEQPGV